MRRHPVGAAGVHSPGQPRTIGKITMCYVSTGIYQP
jgi:hypothetical protein